MGLHQIRYRLVDAPTSLGARRRQRRARWLHERFPHLADMSVIDLGGRLSTWSNAEVRPARVHVVTLEQPPEQTPDWAEVDYGDACALPSHIANRRYDLVFSNSVIEHVGGHERRLRFAEAIHQLAPSYWVQTPYRYFPVEPHWLAPGMQFLPVKTRIFVARKWPLAAVPGKSKAAATQQVLWTELLDKTQLRHYFPDATILMERAWGIPKSMIAFRVG